MTLSYEIGNVYHVQNDACTYAEDSLKSLQSLPLLLIHQEAIALHLGFYNIHNNYLPLN